MTYGKLNMLGESHYNFGLYFQILNKKDAALFHFKKALEYFPSDSPRAEAVNQAIKALKEKEAPHKNPPAHPKPLQFDFRTPLGQEAR